MIMDSIPEMMKSMVEDKYFNLECECNKYKKCLCGPCGPCFPCGRPFRYYFAEIDLLLVN